MRLEKVILKNFRGYSSRTEIFIDDLTAFIGKNDAGKSTILEALEIFFNNSIVSCEREDVSVGGTDKKIEISCVFSDFPSEMVIDTSFPTTLKDEYLLNSEGKLEIKKVFNSTAAKPKEKIFLCCYHPTAPGVDDLLILKRAELRKRAEDFSISSELYDSRINASIRKAIRDNFDNLNLERIDLSVDKEDSKKIYDQIHKYLPIYALFQSDRVSRDDDKEVSDPMKLAVKQAMQELTDEIEHIKQKVHDKAVETANRTLDKLQEMDPDLARELIPEFKSEPNFASAFKLSIKSENDISVNKRGSGVRRLILLNFFRAEAERRRTEHDGDQVIYAFEEPETSQHPDHQEMLVRAFLQLSESPSCQVLLTTHTPALAGLLPLESLRFVEKSDESRTVSMGKDEVFEKIVDTLGVLPHPIPQDATAALLVEGKADFVFVKHTAEKLKEGGYISSDFEDNRFAIIPVGGCGNIKHWQAENLVSQFGIPYCVLLDSDCGTPQADKNIRTLRTLEAKGVKAYLTRKREPENYIHSECLNCFCGSVISFNDTDDAKVLIAEHTRIKKDCVLERLWPNMTCEQIREMEKYEEDGQERYEFTEMFADFFSIVNN